MSGPVDLAPAPETLAVTPVRTASWSEAGAEGQSRVVVERPLPPVRGLASLLRRISALTGVRRLRLDERGSFAWRRFDGATSVGEVARALHAELDVPAADPAAAASPSESRGEAEARLVRFVAVLRRESLVGLPGLDDARIAAWRAGNPSA